MKYNLTLIVLVLITLGLIEGIGYNISSINVSNTYGVQYLGNKFLGYAWTGFSNVLLDVNRNIDNHLDAVSENLIITKHVTNTSGSSVNNLVPDDNIVRLNNNNDVFVLHEIDSPIAEADRIVFENNASKTLEQDLINDVYVADVTSKKDLKFLVIGSSSEQDYISYVPPILQEVLFDYNIVVGNMYVSGGNADDYVRIYRDSVPCTDFNYWTPEKKRWETFRKTYKLEDVLALQQWDMILYKGSTPYLEQLMSIIQSLVDYPVCFITDAMVARPGYGTSGWTWSRITKSAKERVKSKAFVDYVPIAAAMENARSNDILKKTGTVSICEPTEINVPAGEYVARYHMIRKGYRATLKAIRTSGRGAVQVFIGNKPDSSTTSDNLVLSLSNDDEVVNSIIGSETSYIKVVNTGNDDCTIVIEDSHSKGNFMHWRDNQHLQSGLPTLIASYTIVLKLLEMTGNSDRDIYGATFIPTTENCNAIGIRPPKDNASNGLGHGAVCGIVDYLGSDGKHYDRSELTYVGNDASGVLYVTSTIYNNTPDSRSITATENGILFRNINAAKEVAMKTVAHPDELIDCSDVLKN